MGTGFSPCCPWISNGQQLPPGLHPDTVTYMSARASVGAPLDDFSITIADRLVRALHGEPNDDFDTYDVWDRIVYFYTFSYMAGDTAAAHMLNLVDPRDSNDAFRLTFTGSPEFTHDGIEFNGINQYANTHCTPSGQRYNLGLFIKGGTLDGGPYPVTMGTEDGSDNLNKSIQLTKISSLNIMYSVKGMENFAHSESESQEVGGCVVGHTSEELLHLYEDGLFLGFADEPGHWDADKPICIGAINGRIEETTQNVILGAAYAAVGDFTYEEVVALSNILTREFA